MDSACLCQFTAQADIFNLLATFPAQSESEIGKRKLDKVYPWYILTADPYLTASPDNSIHPEEHMAKAKAAKTRALQLNVEGLFKLLGGTPDERLRFWEILKGITTPVELRLINNQLGVLQSLVDQVQASAKALKQTASQIGKG